MTPETPIDTVAQGTAILAGVERLNAAGFVVSGVLIGKSAWSAHLRGLANRMFTFGTISEEMFKFPLDLRMNGVPVKLDGTVYGIDFLLCVRP